MGYGVCRRLGAYEEKVVFDYRGVYSDQRVIVQIILFFGIQHRTVSYGTIALLVRFYLSIV